MLRFRYRKNGQYFEARSDLVKAFGFDGLQPEIEVSLDYSQVNEEISFSDALRSYLEALAGAHRKIYLLYSGGIDSEILLFAARKFGIDVVPVTVDLFGLNSYDISFANEFLTRNSFRNAIRYEVAEKDFRERWLPELFFDTESTAYLLSGAYIGARLCPDDGVILMGGEGPLQLYCEGTRLYYLASEYEFWPKKVERRYGKKIVEPFWDAQLISSFLKYPQIFDRLGAPHPHSSWFFDGRFIGKEYFYSDPFFGTLSRRFSQHGWEAMKGALGYTKEMIPGFNPNIAGGGRASRYYFDPEKANRLVLHFLESGELDRVFANEVLWKNGTLPKSSVPLSYSSFVKDLYVPLPIVKEERGLRWDKREYRAVSRADGSLEEYRRPDESGA